MIQAMETKALELWYRMLGSLRSDERAQTTTEYVLVTMVGAALAITVIWVLLRVVLQDAIGAIADAIAAFVPFA